MNSSNLLSEKVKFICRSESKLKSWIELNPDGTFLNFISYDTWNSEGIYSWESSLKCNGIWIFNPNEKSLTLSYEIFEYLDNQNPQNFLEIFGKPGDIVTIPFDFKTSTTLKALEVEWNMSSIVEVKTDNYVKN